MGGTSASRSNDPLSWGLVVVLCLLTLGPMALAQDVADSDAVKEIKERIARGGLESRIAVEVLLDASDDDWQHISYSGALAPPVLPLLVEMLRNPKPRVRCRAAESLGSIVQSEPSPGAIASTVPVLRAALLDEDHDVRCQAARALAKIGPPSAPAIPLFVEWLGDEDEDIRDAASLALTWMNSVAVPALVKALQDEDPRVRGNAAIALAYMDPPADSAAPSLIKVLRGKSRSVEEHLARHNAAQALGRIKSKAAVPSLVEALGDESEIVRYGAVGALADLGIAARPAVPKLVDLRGDMEVLGSDPAQEALLKIGGPWWTVPYAYRWEGAGLLLLLGIWFSLCARFPRHHLTDNPFAVALFAFVLFVPTVLACGAVAYACTREWAEGMLPDRVLIVPFPMAAVLSTALVCILAAMLIWVRKKPEPPPPPQWRGLTARKALRS